MRNKITFHIALYCLLATATVVAMEENPPVQKISFQPTSLYIKNGDNYSLIDENGKIEEAIAAINLFPNYPTNIPFPTYPANAPPIYVKTLIQAARMNMYSQYTRYEENLSPKRSISLTYLYNQNQISLAQYKYFEEKTKNFTQPLHIIYCDKKYILRNVSVIPTYRIYIKEPSNLSNTTNKLDEMTTNNLFVENPTSKHYEMAMNGLFAEVNILEILLKNNDQIALNRLKDDISATQFQIINALITENKNVYGEHNHTV